MPQYSITAPNGQAYQIEGPEGATQEEIQAEVLRQFPEAGGEVDPSDPTRALDGGLVGSVTDDRPSLEQVGGAFSNVIAGGLEGLLGIPDVLWDAATGLRRAINSGLGAGGSAALEAVGADKAADWWRQGSDLEEASLAQMGRPSTPITNAVPVPDDPAGQWARMGGQFMGGAFVPTPASPKGPTPLKAPIAPSNAVPEAARDIISAGDQAGVRVLTSDVKPPQTFLGKWTQSVGEKIPVAGTGGIRAQQQAERIKAVKDVLRDYGGDEARSYFDDAPGAVEDVAKSLTKQRSAEISRLTNAKSMVIDTLPGEVPVPNAIEAIDQQVSRLNSLNSDAVRPAVVKLMDWRKSLQGQDLRNIEEIRKIMGSSFDEPGLAGIKDVGQKAVNAIYGPLREDMGNFIRSQGGELKFTRWAKANERLAVMAGELKNAKLRNVLKTSDMTPENVGKLLFSGNRSDVERLVSNLDSFGKARAQAAVLQRAFDKSISADGGLSVERFVNNMRSMGSTVGVTFEGADKMRLEGLARLLDATRRASGAAAAPPTGQQNLPALAGYGLGSLLGYAAVPVAATGGLLARAYESNTVRNALINLNKAPKGSRQEAIALDRATTAVTAAVNSNSRDLNQYVQQAISTTPRRAAAEENGDD